MCVAWKSKSLRSVSKHIQIQFKYKSDAIYVQLHCGGELFKLFSDCLSPCEFFARKVHDKGREEAAGLKVGAKMTQVFLFWYILIIYDDNSMSFRESNELREAKPTDVNGQVTSSAPYVAVFPQEPVDWVERKTASDVRSDAPQAATSCHKLSFSEKGERSEANPVYCAVGVFLSSKSCLAFNSKSLPTYIAKTLFQRVAPWHMS